MASRLLKWRMLPACDLRETLGLASWKRTPLYESGLPRNRIEHR